MTEKLNIDQMCSAYRLLYETETRLRTLIDVTLKREQGPFWYHRSSILSINFLTAHYYQFIHIIRKIPILKLKFSDSEIKRLNELNEIRNKICHMWELTHQEYNFLVSCHEIETTQLPCVVNA